MGFDPDASSATREARTPSIATLIGDARNFGNWIKEPNARTRAVEEIRQELDIIAAQVAQGRREDIEVTRRAIGQSISMLMDLHTLFYELMPDQSRN